MRKAIFAAMLGLAVTGCDVSGLAESMGALPPIVVLGMGYEVQISDTETAKVYGNDSCSGELIEIPLNHCTKLTGDTVQVALVSNQRKWVEVWDVDQGDYQVTLTRPNGYQIKQANE